LYLITVASSVTCTVAVAVTDIHADIKAVKANDAKIFEIKRERPADPAVAART
jgi:hypothetical protein